MYAQLHLHVHTNTCDDHSNAHTHSLLAPLYVLCAAPVSLVHTDAYAVCIRTHAQHAHVTHTHSLLAPLHVLASEVTTPASISVAPAFACSTTAAAAAAAGRRLHRCKHMRGLPRTPAWPTAHLHGPVCLGLHGLHLRLLRLQLRLQADQLVGHGSGQIGVAAGKKNEQGRHVCHGRSTHATGLQGRLVCWMQLQSDWHGCAWACDHSSLASLQQACRRLI